jgi:hypothetical protein
MAKRAKKNTENIWVRADAELVRDLDVECARLRIKRPRAIEDAVLQWLSGRHAPEATPGGVREAVPMPSRANGGPVFEKFAQIMASADTRAISAITQSVEVFHERPAPASKRP